MLKMHVYRTHEMTSGVFDGPVWPVLWCLMKQAPTTGVIMMFFISSSLVAHIKQLGGAHPRLQNYFIHPIIRCFFALPSPYLSVLHVFSPLSLSDVGPNVRKITTKEGQ